MKATIIIPIYNGASTLDMMLECLENQNHKEYIDKIFLINDSSRDNSSKIIQKFQKNTSYSTKTITHKFNKGLAATYNEGIKLASSEMVILMHQDILLNDRNSLVKIINPLLKNKNIVASYPYCEYPLETWKNNSFWQQVLFSRLAGKKVGGLNGKFDCYRKTSSLFFDNHHYRTAGEDFDLEIRLRQLGEIMSVDLTVNHIQDSVKHYELRKLIKKEAQLAECYGVNFRRYFSKIKRIDKLILISRLIILALVIIGLMVNYYLCLISILAYCYLYTFKTYHQSFKNPRIILLPLVNLINLILYNFYFSKGYIFSRQKL